MATKLKKKSRTMAYAEADCGPSYHQSNNSPVPKGPVVLHPMHSTTQAQAQAIQLRSNHHDRIQAEQYSYPGHEPAALDDGPKRQYWAARALQAETVLRIREIHYRDMRSEVGVQSEKREKELAALSRQHRERHKSLERLIYILVTIVAALVFVVMYQTNVYSWYHHRDSRRQGWWPSTPAHFTIPILSPFTSVVEHETSVFSSKTITLLICVTGCVVYMTFRYWISRR